jgi:hypothetical protein
MNRGEQVAMVDRCRTDLSMRRQCALLGLARSEFYRQPAADGAHLSRSTPSPEFCNPTPDAANSRYWRSTGWRPRSIFCGGTRSGLRVTSQ